MLQYVIVIYTQYFYFDTMQVLVSWDREHGESLSLTLESNSCKFFWLSRTVVNMYK